ncbi:unnamed protein product [Peniophora sp. CBMAI 1063]|nr:unnamed protein product [Peniophora sp. CBMAI 1063]
MGDWVEDFVKAHKFRLRKLVVGFFVVDKNWIHELDVDTPVLTHVDAGYSYSWPGDYAEYIHGGSFAAPKLRDLVLFSFSPDLSRASWPNLRNLQLGGREPSVDVSLLLSALATAPLLERLLIGQVHRASPTSTQSTIPMIHLDHLERMDVTGQFGGVMTVWKTLVVPSSAMVRFSFEEPTDEDDREGDLNTVLTATRRHMDRSVHPLPGLSLQSYQDTITIAAYREREDSEDILPFKEDTSVIKVEYYQCSSYELPSVMRALPMHACKYLQLSAMIERFWWDRVLAETAHIEALCLSDSNPETTENLAKAVSYSFDDKGETDSTFFPRLHTLHLYRVLYGSRSDSSQPDVVPPALVALREWLERRDHCGVRKLRIQGCSVFPEWVDMFRQIDGLAVEWDGDVRLCMGPSLGATS